MTYRNLHSPAEHGHRHWRRLRWVAAVCAAGFLVSVCSFQARCEGVRRAVLRLHVIANSDSAADQAAKLYVRDKLLLEGAQLFDGSISAAQAQQAITPHVAELEACAVRALAEKGLHYPVRVRVEEAWFDTRTYEQAGVTLPAGRYLAVRVILGAGAGHNWWCVMFPPLCLPAAEPRGAVSLDVLLTAGQLRVVKSNPHYEIRFKLVELWERVKQLFE